MANIPIGLQLYSVREDCKNDLPGVLKEVARMGYAGVEFAGYYGHSAADLRKMLDDLGLICCGTHTGIQTLLGEELPKTIEYNQTPGQQVPDRARPAQRAHRIESGLARHRRYDEQHQRTGAPPRTLHRLP